MRILFATTHVNVGGITQYVYVLSKGMVRRGHDVVVFSRGGDMVPDLAEAGVCHEIVDIQTKSIASPHIWRMASTIVAGIRERQIDVVHSQTRVMQAACTLAARWTGVRHVTTCHGFFKPKWGRKLFPCWGDTVIAISPAVARHLREDLHVKDGAITPIAHGLDLAEFPLVSRDDKMARRSQVGLEGDPVIGIIARLSDVKGHDVLLSAMPDMIGRFPALKVLIVGQGKTEKALKQQVLSLGLSKHVEFWPVAQQTPRVLGLLDLFVMPSRQEGLGLSVMEAQAAGIPVVASNVGGIPSLIQDGKTGWLVPPGDAPALAQKVMSVLSHPDEAASVGLAGRAFVRDFHDAGRMIDQTLSVYKGEDV